MMGIYDRYAQLKEDYEMVAAERDQLEARVAELEQALDEHHTSPELAAVWGAFGATEERKRCAAAGCMRCGELLRRAL